MLYVASRALTIWFGIALLAIVNGAFREAVLIPTVGTAAGLVLSGIILSLLILTATWFALPWLATRSAAHLWGIGLGWVVLTIGFEFSLGLWQGKSWATLLEAYTFEGGNIWPLVLVVTAAAPWVAAKVRGWM